ncbi:MAG: PKD domain-containing protein, partial [Candidatus Bathyarchaeota archaeon]|nr:PKD domain-containing protein [Candidatus Bathyarchaeota archaeon]
IVVVVIALIAMFGVACGPKQATPPPSTTTVGNQPPVISRLVAAQPQVYPGGTVQIQCDAADPDGDQVTFEWACTGGDFSGAGPIVVWRAPSKYGVYTIVVTVKDGKGASTQQSLSMSVTANQAPVIQSLEANPSGVIYGGIAVITCIASDPDGDVVRYSWSASEGTITGTGNKVTWVAPNRGGNYNITVLVSDGKGGETKGNVMVTVAATVKTVTIPLVAEETGTVDSEGDKDNSRMLAGDDAKNVGYCAYFSFDVYGLHGRNIQNANLKFTTRAVVGDPFSSTTGLGGLQLWKVTYGDKLPKFWYTGSRLTGASAILNSPPTVVDVTYEIKAVTAAAATRFQVEALFLRVTNGNSVAEFIEWSNVVLEVTYSD